MYVYMFSVMLLLHHQCDMPVYENTCIFYTENSFEKTELSHVVCHTLCLN